MQIIHLEKIICHLLKKLTRFSVESQFPRHYYRGHFGSRYKLGCCHLASLLAPGCFRFPQVAPESPEAKGPNPQGVPEFRQVAAKSFQVVFESPPSFPNLGRACPNPPGHFRTPQIAPKSPRASWHPPKVVPESSRSHRFIHPERPRSLWNRTQSPLKTPRSSSNPAGCCESGGRGVARPCTPNPQVAPKAGEIVPDSPRSFPNALDRPRIPQDCP